MSPRTLLLPLPLLLLLFVAFHGAVSQETEAGVTGGGEGGEEGGEYSARELATHVDTLLAEYERELPPAPRVQAALALDVRHAALDDRAATMRLLADLHMSWSDLRLTWNSSVWGSDSVLVSAERVWSPDVDATGGATLAGEAGGAGPARARLRADGAVALVRRLHLTVPVDMQLDAWPYDVQTAVFRFASLEYSQDKLDIVIRDFKSAVVMESGAWKVVGVSGETSSWARVGEGDDTRMAAWRVRVARRAGALRSAAAAALLAADLLLLAAAAHPPAARPPLAAAAALLAAAWLVSAMWHVPAGGGSAPRGVRLVGAACAAAAAGGAAAALTARLARRTAPPPAALRALLSRVSAVYSLAPPSHTECGSGGEGGAWAAAATLLDTLLLAALLLTMLVITALFFA